MHFISFSRPKYRASSNAYIIDIPPQLGIRETRRITGAYQLTAEDVVGCASFGDTIGVNGWPLEMHVAGDVVWRWPDIPGSRGYNHLPYRMLTPLNARGRPFDNLLVAGRCASMTHEGQSAARVSGPCFVMGEAAGTAAHVALKSNVNCSDVSIDTLQEALAANGAFLGRAEDCYDDQSCRSWRMKRLAFAFWLVCSAALPAAAQTWPPKTVHIISPFAAGSTPDIVARMVADGLAAKYPGSAFVVENKPGASGNIGTDAVAKAAPDGSTLGVSIGGPLAINTLLFANLPYNPGKDIASDHAADHATERARRQHRS